MSTLYNHAFTVPFSLQSTIQDGGDIPAAELLAALKERVAYLEKHPKELEEACGAAFDSYEASGPSQDIHEATLVDNRKIIVLAEPGADIQMIYINKKSRIPDVIVKLNHTLAHEMGLCDDQAFRDRVFYHLRMAGYSGAPFGRAELGAQGANRIVLEPNSEFDAFAKSIGWIDIAELEESFRLQRRDQSVSELLQAVKDLGIEHATRDITRDYKHGGMSDEEYQGHLLYAIALQEARVYTPPSSTKLKI